MWFMCIQLWKAEHQAEEEERKAQELRKAHAEEREREELEGVAIAGGHKQ